MLLNVLLVKARFNTQQHFEPLICEKISKVRSVSFEIHRIRASIMATTDLQTSSSEELQFKARNANDGLSTHVYRFVYSSEKQDVKKISLTLVYHTEILIAISLH